MNKIPTLFVRDPDNRARVIDQVNPGCEWVIRGEGVATRKYDGTCVYLDESGAWWARREVKPGKAAPYAYVPISTDPVTGKTMGWQPIEQSSFAKYQAEAIDTKTGVMRWLGSPGTYELCGPKINGNPEGFIGHYLVSHAEAMQLDQAPRNFADLAAYLARADLEGIVWHHPDGSRMCKIKKRDFGLTR